MMLGTADLDLLSAMMEPLTECPFFVKNADLRYVAANSAMAAICGLSHPKDIIGLRAGDIFRPDTAQHYELLDRKVLATRRGVRDLLELTGVGQHHWLLYSRTPICDDHDQAVGVIGTSRRLTVAESREPAVERVAKVIQKLRGHAAEPLDVSRLAVLAGVSISQLERDARRVLGVTLRQFQQRGRMHLGMALLDSDMSIAAIASDCGFADQSAFARRFRVLVGTSPQRFRIAKKRSAAVGEG
jgi:AraC-like DNA-binding protein